MRKLLCIGAIAVSALLAGCGGTEPANLDTLQQGLACRYPDMSCPSGTICIDGDLCRKPCPASGLCADGRACRVSEQGTRFCF